MDKKLLVLLALILAVVAGVIAWLANDRPKASEILR